jgi:hypothetical protein
MAFTRGVFAARMGGTLFLASLAACSVVTVHARTFERAFARLPLCDGAAFAVLAA